jgi:hypothetical protein
MAGVYIVLAFSPPEQADFVVAKHRDRGSLTGAEPTYQPVADGDAAERGE